MRIFLFFALFPFYIYGQKNTSNTSNPLALPQQNLIVKEYIDKADYYWKKDLDSSAYYAFKAHDLANQFNSMEDVAHALIRICIYQNNNGDIELSRTTFQEAFDIAQRNKFKDLEAELYHIKGQIFNLDSDSTYFYYQKSMNLAMQLDMHDLLLKNKIRLARIYLHQKKHTELAALFDEIIPILNKEKNYDGLMETYMCISLVFRDLGDKDKALLYSDKALQYANLSDNDRLKASTYSALGSGVISYFASFELAEPLIRESIKLSMQLNDKSLIAINSKRLAVLYCNFEYYDQAESILDKLLIQSKDPDVYKFKGIVLYAKKKYQEANKFYNKAYSMYEEDKAYAQQRAVLQLKLDNKMEQVGDKELINDFLTYEEITDRIHSDESKNQFFELETKYRTAEKEAAIQIKDLELTRSNFRILLLSLVCIIFVLFAGFAYLILQNRQKRLALQHANELLELQSVLNTTELANLNNQLNPHEIKNLISSIAPDLLTKAPDAYKKLIRLFNVTRASLSNNLTEPIEVQVKQVEDYLTLMQSISPYQWDFEVDNDLVEQNIELPRLILKNLAENAVKYGMSSIKEGGFIKVELKKLGDVVKIEVSDNGKGINNEHGNKEATGIGLSTYLKLIKFANKQNEGKAALVLVREENWTKAEITLPIHYKFT